MIRRLIRAVIRMFIAVRFFAHRYHILTIGGYLFALLWITTGLIYYSHTEDLLGKQWAMLGYSVVSICLLLNFSSTWGKVITNRYLRFLVNSLMLWGTAMVIAVYCVYLLGDMHAFYGDNYSLMLDVGTNNSLLWMVIIPFAIYFLPGAFYYHVYAKHLCSLRVFEQFKTGKGGREDFGSVSTYRDKGIRYRWFSGKRTADILLGSTTYEYTAHTKYVGDRSDSNLCTFGTIGSGKTTTVLSPVIATYAGSMIIVDPKSEHYETTQARRGETKPRFKGRTFALSPFDDKGIGYNPLSEIDINDPNSLGLISAIAEACVIDEQNSQSGKFFVEMPRQVISGVIAHVLSTFPKENHNLPFVLDLLYGTDLELQISDPALFKELLFEMRCNPAAGGLAQRAAKDLLDMGDRELGAVLTSISQSVNWIGDPMMRQHLVGSSDLRFNDIGVDGYNSTVYLCLPLGRMESHKRWLRLITSVSLSLMRDREQRPKIPTLFILDEFPQMKKLDIIVQAYATQRSSGTKLWVFAQNWSQLKSIYGENAHTFIATSTTQWFGIGDLETAKVLSESLGKRMVRGRYFDVLSPSEVMGVLNKEANLQVVLPASSSKGRIKKPYLLERLTYRHYRTDFRAYRGHAKYYRKPILKAQGSLNKTPQGVFSFFTSKPKMGPHLSGDRGVT